MAKNTVSKVKKYLFGTAIAALSFGGGYHSGYHSGHDSGHDSGFKDAEIRANEKLDISRSVKRISEIKKEESSLHWRVQEMMRKILNEEYEQILYRNLSENDFSKVQYLDNLKDIWYRWSEDGYYGYWFPLVGGDKVRDYYYPQSEYWGDKGVAIWESGKKLFFDCECIGEGKSRRYVENPELRDLKTRVIKFMREFKLFREEVMNIPRTGAYEGEMLVLPTNDRQQADFYSVIMDDLKEGSLVFCRLPGDDKFPNFELRDKIPNFECGLLKGTKVELDDICGQIHYLRKQKESLQEYVAAVKTVMVKFER
ncbi:MAG: hypothetical protein MJ187_03680 [Alphaproteobacteria bacterium]|nr:hypothetical protein [Alphaproteobacteria bacterium]